jgi:hypothetical protein
MITNTVMIFGPGGIGKGPIDDIIRNDAIRIDPYRLRPAGPRDKGDIFYAHKKLRSEMTNAFELLGDSCERLSEKPEVEWFPKCKTTFFDVRGEWQWLLLGGLSATLAKAEIYAPAVPILFSRPDVRSLFGTLSIIILNPADSLPTLNGDFTSIKSKTTENCSKRKDSDESIEKRVGSIDEEAAAWENMLKLGGTEFPNWELPEYIYRTNQIETMLAARNRLIEGNSALEQFFKSEAEIQAL